MRGLSLAVSATLLATSAQAYRLTPYDGPAAVQTGTGGSHVERHGVDFWVTGTPPRQFKIIGTMRDERNSYHDGTPGSSKIAKAILAAGGDAAIITNESTSKRSGAIVPVGGYAVAVPVKDEVTDLLIVKYID